MKRWVALGAAVAATALVLTGCSTSGSQSEVQTGTTTQRMGTGYAGPVTTPGPGASGR